MPLSEAVDRCESWYDERGLPRMFSLFGPAGFVLDDDPLGRELLERAYEPAKSTAVLTTATAALQPEVPHASGALVSLESVPSPQWWDAWAARDGRTDHASAPPPAARAVMTGSPDQLFALLEVDGAVVGVARVAFARRWAGVAALHVAPEHRRNGVAMQIMGALADASRARGIRSMYLQVEQANSPALGLYERLGFSVHHEYRYLGQ
jgi:ribosomal protein S18 acetylase RimI-like enzyme